MKLSALLKTIEAAPPETPVIYATQTATIGKGYHLTEIKAAQISGIDCGGNMSHYHEVTMQLLDGSYGRYMTSQKLSRILQHSLKKLPELDKAEVRVEFSPNNEGLQIFSLQDPELSQSGIRLPLLPEGAVCKPALAAGATCGPSTCKTQAACC